MARGARSDKAEIKPIRNEAEYDAALAAIEQYFEDEPQPGTPEADCFDLLALVIRDYEEKHWPVDLPDPISAIEFAMEQRGITRSDLEPIMGSRGRVSEILNRRRHLTLPMIWGLSQKLGIPADALIKPYPLAARPGKGRIASGVRAVRRRSRRPARGAAQAKRRSTGKTGR